MQIVAQLVWQIVARVNAVYLIWSYGIENAAPRINIRGRSSWNHIMASLIMNGWI